MLALETEFERPLNLHNEGYETDNYYNLPLSLNKSTLI